MAGVLPRLAPARMYPSALCSAAAAAPFSRCSLGSLSACTSHQPLDGRCTRIKKPLAVRCKCGLSFCNNFTRFLAICVLCSFYNGRRKYDGIRMKLSIFSLSNIVSFANASLCGQKNSDPWFPKGSEFLLLFFSRRFQSLYAESLLLPLLRRLRRESSRAGR